MSKSCLSFKANRKCHLSESPPWISWHESLSNFHGISTYYSLTPLRFYLDNTFSLLTGSFMYASEAPSLFSSMTRTLSRLAQAFSAKMLNRMISTVRLNEGSGTNSQVCDQFWNSCLSLHVKSYLLLLSFNLFGPTWRLTLQTRS